MGQIISAILSPAVGVLISPFPIVGLILILLSEKARVNSIFYMIGWIAGNALVCTIAMLCMSAGIRSQGEPSTLAKIISFVLGGLLIVCAVMEFIKRPKAGEDPKTPKWFDKMSKISSIGAIGFSLFLSALNPKNALLSLSAGAAIGALNLSGAQEGLAVGIYTLIASISIIVPTIAFLIAGQRLDKTLDAMRSWLIHNNAVIMSVLLLMIGLNMITKAL